MDSDTNVNLASCIVQKSHFGYDTMINICSGQSVNVDWAFGDWVGFAALVFIAGIFLACVCLLAAMVWGDR